MSEPRLKNARARLTTKPIETIQEALASHNVKQMSLDYEQGRAIAITFALEVNGQLRGFRLPARIHNVEIKLYGRKATYTETQKKQAYVTAWANIRDWILAQIAMIDIGLVKTEEVFLPYMLADNGQTVYEAFEQRQLQLGSGH